MYTVYIERMNFMTDWKEMYLTMMRGTEQAIRILIETQRKCEELYLSAEEPAPAPPSDRQKTENWDLQS